MSELMYNYYLSMMAELMTFPNIFTIFQVSLLTVT